MTTTVRASFLFVALLAEVWARCAHFLAMELQWQRNDHICLRELASVAPLLQFQCEDAGPRSVTQVRRVKPTLFAVHRNNKGWEVPCFHVVLTHNGGLVANRFEMLIDAVQHVVKVSDEIRPPTSDVVHERAPNLVCSVVIPSPADATIDYHLLR